MARLHCKLGPALLAVLLALAVAASAGVKDPISGDAFHTLVDAQDVELQELLEAQCARLSGDDSRFLVTGPMDPFYDGDEALERLMHSVRVVCSNAADLRRLVGIIQDNGHLTSGGTYDVRHQHDPGPPYPGFRGASLVVRVDDDDHRVLILTENENRWLVWVRDVHANGYADVESAPFVEYARAVSDHLLELRDDPAREEAAAQTCPQATAFDLPAAASFYPPRPPYVIEGYQNFKDFLHAHAEVATDFATGITAFVPGDSLRRAMADDPPPKAWPNKEQPLLQHEYRKFFSRGGDTAVMHTLTAEMIPDLQPGEYFYAVGLSGRIRFGYETPREEVDRIERETGRKLARANHAYLFPGEPVLTAGAFFVADDAHGRRRIVEVNAQSGHYFYSNITATIREDIAVRSDEYLMTLGHFLAALERLGVDTAGMVLSKL